MIASHADKSLAAGRAQAHSHQMELDEQYGRSRDDPEEPIAVVGAQHRVRGNAGRIVVRQSGQQTRTKDREKSGDSPNATGSKTGESKRNATPMMSHDVRRCAGALTQVACRRLVVLSRSDGKPPVCRPLVGFTLLARTLQISSNLGQVECPRQNELARMNAHARPCPTRAKPHCASDGP